MRSPPASSAAASASRSIGCSIERGEDERGASATEADAALTARIFTSSPMWNITHPEASTTTSGRQTATTASPTSRRRRVGSRAQREGDREADGERRERDDERGQDHGMSR